MPDDKFQMFQNRLTKVYRHIGKQARRMGVTCYRVYDHDLPEFPLCIEVYEENGYVAEYKRRHGMTEDEHDSWMERCIEIISEVMTLNKANIFLKLRQRKPGRLGQYQKSGEEKHEFVVTEAGLKFRVNLSDYLDTGLFLDHRVTRQMVREGSKGKHILNLFAYTGSFSVYAAAGDAQEVVTVDLSKTYLDWSEQNLKLNAFDDPQKYKIVHADVLQWLPSVPAQSFDMIIMDPPTFSNSKRMKDFLDIQQDHVGLINQCMRILSPGGVLYFSTNYRKFELEKEKINAAEIKDITKSTTPFDFEGRLTRVCYRMVL
ncbi:MAG: class I SAM-dependent methyltransferase [Chitinophagaceae bacterium]|nr:class I SAM-dependent methyltransferase [Chitinophagaceae bacterium]